MPEVRHTTKSSDCVNKPHLHGLKRIVVRVRGKLEMILNCWKRGLPRFDDDFAYPEVANPEITPVLG